LLLRIIWLYIVGQNEVYVCENSDGLDIIESMKAASKWVSTHFNTMYFKRRRILMIFC
jgi:hypothetical protein